jgi:hypothetical protein
MTIDVVAFNHAIESFPVDCQHTCRRLFVAARVFKHARNVTSFDDR